jgi:hypothetical protein
VRRRRRLRPARGRALLSARPQAAGLALPPHHPPGTVRRAGAVQRRRAGVAEFRTPWREMAPGVG